MYYILTDLNNIYTVLIEKIYRTRLLQRGIPEKWT